MYVLAAKVLMATDVVVDVVVALFAVGLMGVEADSVTDLTAVKSDQGCLLLEMPDHLVLEMHDRPVLEMHDHLIFETPDRPILGTPYCPVLWTPVYGQHSPTAD